MKLQTERHGRALAVRTLRRLAKAGPEKCRADEHPRHVSQAGALRVAIYKLLEKGTTEARDGFSAILTDALGARYYLPPLDLVKLYEGMQCARRFRERHGKIEEVETGTEGLASPGSLTEQRATPPE